VAVAGVGRSTAASVGAVAAALTAAAVSGAGGSILSGAGAVVVGIVASAVGQSTSARAGSASVAVLSYATSNNTVPRRLDRNGPVWITLEIEAAIDAAGSVRTYYFANRAFSTYGGDTPEHIAFDTALADPGSITQTAFGDGRTGGATRLSLGEVRINNADSAYDNWIGYGFDGRRLTIRRGYGGSYPSDYETIFTGTVETVTVTRREAIIRLRDKQLIFDAAVLTDLYGGSNVLPNGIDGTAADLAGKPKPRLIGSCRNIAPPCVNTSKLVYQVHSGRVAEIAAVYDKALGLTFGVDRANAGDLLSNTPAAGAYDTCLAQGLFRLGSNPAGQVTADAAQGAAAVDRTAASILLTLALEAGVAAGDVDAGDLSALAADAPAELGMWLSDAGVTYRQAMDRAANSVGAYFAFDPDGVLRAGRLVEPAGDPVLEIADYDVNEPFERRPARDGDIPIWRVTVRHSRVWTVQASDIAASVSPARRALIGSEYRDQSAFDATVKDQFRLAGEESIETLLISEADAANEAFRRLNLRKVRRSFYDVGITAAVFSAAGVKIGDVVRLTHPRFGLSAGKLFVVLGVNLQLARGRVTLTLWG